MLETETLPYSSSKPVFARPMRVRRSRPEKAPTKTSKLPRIKMHVKGKNTLAIMSSSANTSQLTDSGVDLQVSKLSSDFVGSKSEKEEGGIKKEKYEENNNENEECETQKMIIETDTQSIEQSPRKKV